MLDVLIYVLSLRQDILREWLSGGASPCQGEGRGFESRLALKKQKGGIFQISPFCFSSPAGLEGSRSQLRFGRC